MKILLIGGTGTISAGVSREIAARGHALFVLNRGTRGDALPERTRVIKGDIRQERTAAELLEGQYFDAVADFIAFETADAERAYRLFGGKTSQYIFISSASAYQKPLRHYLVTESTPLCNPFWQYSRNKIACEDALMRHYREDGFPVTIVRPSHTYDHRSAPLAVHGHHGSFSVLKRMLAGKPVPIHGDGTSLWTFTHASDFARGFAGLLGNPQAVGEAVHITGDQSITWNMAYDILAGALGTQCIPLHIASGLLAAEGKAWGYDFEGALLGDKAHSVVFDNSKLKRLVPGFTAVKRYEEGAAETVRYVMSHPELQREDPDFDRFCDRLAEIMEKIQR